MPLALYCAHSEAEFASSGPEPKARRVGPAPISAMGGLRMGASATTKINRKDFGVNGAPPMVGDEISITIDVEVTKIAPAAQ